MCLFLTKFTEVVQQHSDCRLAAFHTPVRSRLRQLGVRDKVVADPLEGRLGIPGHRPVGTPGPGSHNRVGLTAVGGHPAVDRGPLRFEQPWELRQPDLVVLLQGGCLKIE